MADRAELGQSRRGAVWLLATGKNRTEIFAICLRANSQARTSCTHHVRAWFLEIIPLIEAYLSNHRLMCPLMSSVSSSFYCSYSICTIERGTCHLVPKPPLPPIETLPITSTPVGPDRCANTGKALWHTTSGADWQDRSLR